MCDFFTGLCTCFSPFTGVACNIETDLSTSEASTESFRIEKTSPEYTGEAVKIDMAKGAATDFSFLSGYANSEKLFFIRGDGAMTVASLVTKTGGVSSAGTITVTTGGIDVNGGGAKIVEIGDAGRYQVYSTVFCF